jgi:very-short-patch-repair endonuclease
VTVTTDDAASQNRSERPTIDADVAACVNYASWQNSVPLLRSLEICNQSSLPLTDLRLEVTSSPACLRPKNWVIDRLASNSSLSLSDRDIRLDPDYLKGLNEAERGVVTFRLIQNDKLIAEAEHEIRVLARDEWGGMAAGAELLAAFVTPNDPAVASVIKDASKVLEQHGHSSALDGYQSRDPQRAWLLVAALWSSVAARSLTYANPPGSFEQVGQKTRLPSAILGNGLATCLDSTLLFAAATEAVGLNPVIVMLQGHCFVGVWLVETTFRSLIETDCSEIRKAIAAKELVTFETTLVTKRPPATFEVAVRRAAEATQESAEHEFVATIDIARARMAQIRPLASHLRESVADHIGTEPVDTGLLPLPDAPSLDRLPPEESEKEARPTTPDGRIDRWQRKLLDLSLRNRLLNFRATKQSIPLLCPRVSLLEDRLASGVRLRIISLPEQNPLGERDAELHRQTSNQDLDTEFAGQALERNEIACPLTENELTSRLTTIYRAVQNDLSEGGTNTLFLAVGFLRWKPRKDDSRICRAPLLLVPVKLVRKSAISPFYLVLHEDDVRFNATLIQLLKKDFGRDLTYLETDLPKDDSGIDVPQVFERVRRDIRDIPGFEVVEESALGTFSFAKYLMWKDLVDRLESLTKNRVVRHLIQNPDQPFDVGGSPIPRPFEIDFRYEPKEIFHPLPADSSQLAAVMAASEGKDFVLVGPPGTGKSQTIANIVSQCLAIGKTVLFVAEKTAALDVVYRRLRQHGLGDCCVELHSNKAERRRFLDQLEQAWLHNRQASDNDWLQISERLKVRRDQLNAYVAAIHRTHSNGWTAYAAMGLCVRGRTLETPGFGWADSVQHDRAAFQQLQELVSELALVYEQIDWKAPLFGVSVEEWSAGWERNLLEECRRVREASETLRQSLSAFLAAIGLPGSDDCSREELTRLSRLATALTNAAAEDVTILFHKQFAKFPAAAQELRTALDDYRQAHSSASACYDDTLNSIPIDEMDHQWRQAVASIWPLSWFARRKVTRVLQSYASTGNASPAIDLAAIRRLRETLTVIDSNLLAGQTCHWKRDETGVEQVQSQIRLAAELRQSIIAVGQPLNTTNQISKAIHPHLSGRTPDAELYHKAQQFTENAQKLEAALASFQNVAGETPAKSDDSGIIAAVIGTATQIEQHRTGLKRWTLWCQVRRRAVNAGLAEWITTLQSGELSTAELPDRFRLGYARWWIPRVVDNDSVLRTFESFSHEDAIADFCALDDLARATAASRAKQSIAHDLPLPEGVARKSELGLLRHQMGLKRPSKSIREVISGLSDSFGRLAPCLLMSPLSIAQYLPPEHPPFDVVIFDEASQITTWDAVGAIARGQQTIIVGDPKQLPPTNFFGRSDDESEDESIEDYDKDLESILDEAKASGLPVLQLNWHYRSRHESLIAFSNWNYYDNKLVTFPAAESADRGVSFRLLPEAVYDRGKSRTNRAEAEAIVRDAVERMKRELELPEDKRLTFGVITFNSQQQSLIQDFLDQAQRDEPELDWFFADERIEPTVVKNLENVQGDERDVMFFSVTFGKDASGREIPLTFGALNRDGGERRLNVAVTRTRQELVVYSSFRADQLKAERSKARGVRDLKAFLEYAEKGPEALIARIEGSVGDFESPLEEAVAATLTDRGWQVTPQVGVSGFRIDLGIVHPDRPGAYLAGVECDGATYHSSAVARDRDKTRQQVLENLGWNIQRVWSPEWWYDAATAIDRLHTKLTGLLDADRQIDSTEVESMEDDEIEFAEFLVLNPDEADSPSGPVRKEPLFAHNAADDSHSRAVYRRTQLDDESNNQNSFFDSSYDEHLRSMALRVLAQESPIREDLLARQVARAHGFNRTGSNIRARILELLDAVFATEESTGRFLWELTEAQPVIDFRFAASESDRRSVDEIPLAELVGLITANRRLMEANDPPVDYARLIGLARLSQSARDRITEAIAAVRRQPEEPPV